jgi:hypothetical protein
MGVAQQINARRGRFDDRHGCLCRSKRVDIRGTVMSRSASTPRHAQVGCGEAEEGIFRIDLGKCFKISRLAEFCVSFKNALTALIRLE